MKQFLYIVLFCGFLNLQAQVDTEFEINDFRYKVTSIINGEETVEVIAFLDSRESGFVHEIVDYNNVSYNVTSIGTSAFENKGLTSFIMSSNITSIGASAFYNNPLLTEFTYVVKAKITEQKRTKIIVEVDELIELPNNIFDNIGEITLVLTHTNWLIGYDVFEELEQLGWASPPFKNVEIQALLSSEEVFLEKLIQTRTDATTLYLTAPTLNILNTTIFNSLGREIVTKTKKFTNIPIANLAKGVYFIKIETNKGNITKQVIIN